MLTDPISSHASYQTGQRRGRNHVPLFSVFVLKWQLLSFVIVIVQFCALTWYMLSYVPYGQQCLKRLIARMT